ncbi:MAG: PilT/PilU family type 4a pilus ATPase [Deltaproteobacteria bacterium]|nr:PilT/PilU family type 4a pilus ATPase [Deltaproteobacteria bacterium]
MARTDLVRSMKEDDWSQQSQVERFLSTTAEGELLVADTLRVLEALLTKTSETAGLKNRCAAFARLVERAPEPALFVPFVRTMKTNDGVVRLVLTTLLPKVNDVAHHAELCSLLKSNDVPLRRAAAGVLGRVGGKTTFELLSAWAKEPGFAGRAEAADVLFPIAGHYAIPAMTDALAVASPAEKIHLIGYFSEPRYVGKDLDAAKDALTRLFGDLDPNVQLQAVRGLGQIGTEEDWFARAAPLLESPSLPAVRAGLEGAKRWPSPKTVRMLEKSFRAGPTAVRLMVIEAAEAMAHESALPLCVDALSHTNISVRTRAASAISQLSKSGRVDVGRTILWLLRNRDPNVRRMASDIASRVKDPSGELWPKLLAFLRDEDWWVRERVTDALLAMAGTELVRHLVSYLADPSDVIRRYAVGVLSRLKDPSVLGALVRTAQGDRDWWVREAAISALGDIGDARAVPYVLDLLLREPELRYVALSALDALGAKDVAPHVAGLLTTPDDADLRLAVLTCLDRLDEPSVAESVRLVENDADHRVRNLAREVLGRWDLTEARRVGQNTIGSTLGLLDQLLYATARMEGDDLVLEGGRRPYVKRRGSLEPISERPLAPEELAPLIKAHLSPSQERELEALRDIDFSYEVKSQGLRFRAHVFHQLTGLSAVFRVIRDRVPSIESLGLPPIIQKLAEAKNGLVLVGGPAGSGKSTTLAAIVHHINLSSARHIITIEDPIEHVHSPAKGLVTQREIGGHSRSYATALRAALRQDPDVILVGELRDIQTIGFAVSAAETGHLVLGTMHTVSAESSVDRLINAFSPDRQPQVRAMLAGSLRAVVCQHLLPKRDGSGRVLAVEVMINNDAIANLIRKGKAFQIGSVLVTSRPQGMQTMDSELLRLYREGLVSAEEAYVKAQDKKEFESLFDPLFDPAPAAAAS